MDKFPGKKEFCLLGYMLGTAACYLLGTIWLAVQLEIGFGAALLIGVVPFLPGDIIKIIAALWLGDGVYRALIRAGYKG